MNEIFPLSKWNEALNTSDLRLESLTVYRVQVDKARHFSFGTWHNRQHGWFALRSGQHVGWAEQIITRNDPEADLSDACSVLRELQGLRLTEAFELLKQRRGVWREDLLEAAEMALLDIAGQALSTPALELLNLDGRDSVPGLFCILEESAEAAREAAQESLRQNLKTHCKIKIFGRSELDCELVKTVREEFGPSAYLTADANGGYEFSSVENLAEDMIRLREAGLNACEDPANMSNDDWIELQQKVGELSLLPDYPVKVSWKALETLKPGMGRIYNIHPANTGSILESVKLGHKIQSYGAKLMIGDDSLVGPACTAWQQIAIGLGAAWCEALEKPTENNLLAEVTQRRSTEQKADGTFGLKNLSPGWGLQIDENKLAENATPFHLFGV